MKWHPINLAGGPYQLRADGLRVTKTPTLTQAHAAGAFLAAFHQLNPRWLAEWWIDLKARFPHTYSQALDVETFDADTLNNYAWVVQHIPARNWMLHRGVSFSAHQSVAGLDAMHQRRILLAAAEGHWTVKEVRQQVAKVKRRPAQAGQAPSMHTVEVTIRVSLEAETAYAAAQAAWAQIKAAIREVGHAHVIAAHTIGLSTGRARRAMAKSA